jgi:hypothetical protein
LYLVVTSILPFSTKSLSIDIALCKYPHQLSLKSIIIPSLSIFFSKVFLNSSAVSSQNILIEIYAIFQSSNNSTSTEGILILSLITSFSNIFFSHFLSISNRT